MTIENYRKAEGKGVSGPLTPTCFPSALDSVSIRQSISDETYTFYEQAFVNQYLNGVNSRRSRETYRTVLNDAGVTSLKGLVVKKVKTEDETVRVLENAKRGKWRVIIRTGESHVVGLKNTQDGWRMVGTWTPAKSEDRFTSNEIFPFLNMKKYKGKPVANIILVAPEKRKTE